MELAKIRFFRLKWMFQRSLKWKKNIAGEKFTHLSYLLWGMKLNCIRQTVDSRSEKDVWTGKFGNRNADNFKQKIIELISQWIQSPPQPENKMCTVLCGSVLSLRASLRSQTDWMKREAPSAFGASPVIQEKRSEYFGNNRQFFICHSTSLEHTVDLWSAL